jgi:4-amino-4-deoxy-L-arabinose transferase-like glycosyltransferase
MNLLQSTWKQWEKHPKFYWIISIIWLIFIIIIAFLLHLGSMGLVDKTEPMFVEAARQMFVTGDWVTPYWNDATRFDKPPLIYWLITICFHIFGVHELAARLPSAIFAIALVILCFYTLLDYGFSIYNQREKPDFKTACLGAGILALNPAWIAWGRTGVSDMFLASSMDLGLLAFFLGYTQSETPKLQQKWFLASSIFTALAVLAKGPVAIVLPGAIIIAFLLYVGQFKQVFKEIPFIKCILLFLAISVPWFVLVIMANGQIYIDTFFGYHNLQRYTSVVSNHPGPFYYYLPVILIALIPWSFYLPIAIARLNFWKINLFINSDRREHLGIFALIWFTIVVVFFSISVTKLPSYILPAIPAAVIIITMFWQEQMNNIKYGKKYQILLWTSISLNILILTALTIVSIYIPQLIGKDGTVKNIGNLVQQSGLNIKSAIIWGLITIISLFLLIAKKRKIWLSVTNLIGMIAFISLAGLPMAIFLDGYRQLPLRQLSAKVIATRKPQEELLFIGFIRPSLVFYTQKPVRFMNDKNEAGNYLRSRQLTGTILLMIEDKNLPTLGLKPEDYQIIDHRGVYQLIRISTNLLL